MAEVTRSLPHAREAEFSVLGGCLIDPEAVAKALDELTEQDFFVHAHQLIYRAICRLFERGVVIDAVTVAEELQAMGELEHAGGVAYLAELTADVPTAANIEYHARIVAERAQLRALHRAASATIHDVEHYAGDDVGQIVDRAQQRIFEAVRDGGGETSTLKQTLTPVFALMEERAKHGDGLIGVPSGLQDLDEMTGGWQSPDLILVAGRPSMGKTAAVVGFALEAIMRNPTISVGIFSLEMSKEQLAQRFLAYESRVDLRHIICGQLGPDELHQVAQAAAHLNTSRILIDDRGGLSVLQVRATARRWKAQRPDLGLIIVDYLQLMTASGENRTQEVSQISRELKNLAKELGVPVIALSQLTREPTKRQNQRPQLSDLRESGALEQDADLVMFVHRPEYYLTPAEAAAKGLVGKAELIIGKHRNGPTGIIECFYRKECCRFESFTNRAA